MATLSVALICLNEEARLPAWLESVRPVADEVVAVDAGSTDHTVELLAAAGVRVEHRDWTGYGDQRNHAASLCSGEWILFLDADERLDPDMAASLTRFKQSPPPSPDLWELPFKVFFFGRFLRHGGFFPEYHRRLMRRGRARWRLRQVHERLEAQGPVGRLQGGYVEHYSYDSVGQYLRRLDRYSSEAARQMLAQGQRTGAWQAWAHGSWAFARRYLLQAGFLDGWAGYLAARLEGLYTFTKYAKLKELQQGPKP